MFLDGSEAWEVSNSQRISQAIAETVTIGTSSRQNCIQRTPLVKCLDLLIFDTLQAVPPVYLLNFWNYVL